MHQVHVQPQGHLAAPMGEADQVRRAEDGNHAVRRAVMPLSRQIRSNSTRPDVTRLYLLVNRLRAASRKKALLDMAHAAAALSSTSPSRCPQRN